MTCQHSGCYNLGFVKYGGYCRNHRHEAPQLATTKRPATGPGDSKPTQSGRGNSVPRAPKLSTRTGKQLETNTEPAPVSVASKEKPRRFIHRWGCEYLLLTADGRIPVGQPLLPLFGRLVESLPVATHGCRKESSAVGSALEDLALELEGRGLVLFPVPNTLYELLLITARFKLGRDKEDYVEFPGFTLDEAVHIPSWTVGKAAIEPARCDKCTVGAWKAEKHRQGHPNIAAHYRSLRTSPEHLAFRCYANAWIAQQLHQVSGHRITEGGSMALFLKAAVGALEGTSSRVDRGKTWETAYQQLSGSGKRQDVRNMLLCTIPIEYEPCAPGTPGFLLYRGTGPYSEQSSLEGGYDLSYGASLFGGWFFDGPTNATSSACAIQYLLTANGKDYDYWIVRLNWHEYLDQTKASGIAANVLLPAIPLSVQLFGFLGGFHARLWKRPAVSAGSLTAFMKTHHLCYSNKAFTSLRTSVEKLLPTPVDLDSLAAAELVEAIERLDTAAEKRGWVRHPVPGGGDCLYHAVLTHFSLEELGIDANDDQGEASALRAALAAFIDKRGSRWGHIDTLGLKQAHNDAHTGADMMPYIIQEFIQARGLQYNLVVYSCVGADLKRQNLGDDAHPELPIAQWQNYQGGHFDPMLPLLIDA